MNGVLLDTGKVLSAATLILTSTKYHAYEWTKASDGEGTMIEKEGNEVYLPFIQ